MTDPRAPFPEPAREDDVARAYDRWSANYDLDRNLTRDLDAEVFRRESPDVSGRDVLELGCGTGKNTAWLAQRARRVVALDFSAGMLERARDRIGAAHVTFLRHDLREPWPLANASFDVVVANLVLEHIRHPAPIYSEAARVLRSGGQLFLSELHPERQRLGAQAHFIDASAAATVHVPAHRHTVSELVNAGLAAELMLLGLGEWLEGDASPDSPPRLLSLRFEKARE